MKRLILAAVILPGIILPGRILAADNPKKPKPPENRENIEKGRVVYFKRCSFCHGLSGDGNGPAADYMDPRPRDFTLGTFKFRTTQSGELPLDGDLFRTISRGLSGTAMPSFDNDVMYNGLTEEERWQVVYYIKTFAPEFSNPDFDPSGKVVAMPSETAPYNRVTIAKGKEIFERAKCRECHGKKGRGDGLKALDRKDDWGFPIRIRNLTQPWKIKGGAEIKDIYMRFSTGISGTPMPSYEKTLTEEERWSLANYIRSLRYEPTYGEIIKARKVGFDIPDDPEDTAWRNAEPMDVRMMGQVIAAPRWRNPAIEVVTIKSMYNDKEIGFLLEWDDPFPDKSHDESKEFGYEETAQTNVRGTYVAANNMIPRNLGNFRDSIAMQFPVKITGGIKKPYFFRGNSRNPVNLWIWKADRAAAGKSAVEETNATGHKRPLILQPSDKQQVKSSSIWRDGRYKLVMKRPLHTSDEMDAQFEEGRRIPVAINAWDGSNGEHGMIMSLSAWHYLFLEASTPLKVYIYVFLGIVLTGLGELWLVRKLNRGAR